MSDYTDALRRELGYYEAQGKDDRAAEVRAELDRAAAAEVAELRKAAAERAQELQEDLEEATAVATTGRSLRRGKKEQATPAAPETAAPADAAGITEAPAAEPAGDPAE